jgi:hypothetical protein
MPSPNGGAKMPCSACFGSGECRACAEDCEKPNDYDAARSRSVL